MNNQHPNPKGYLVVRRLTTDPDKGAPFWPGQVIGCTQMVEPGWAGYLELIISHVAQMGIRLVTLLGEGKEPEEIALSDWNAGAYLTMYQRGNMLPCASGVAPPMPREMDLFVLDETSVIEDGRVGYEVVAYRPREDDYLPAGIRLPVTELDKIAREAGRVKVLIQNAPGQESVIVSGCFADESDTAAQEVIRKIRSAELPEE